MTNYLKIGEISKLCNIPIKTLRYYEEEKLITPVEVDFYSGYRHYDEKNIERIYQIQFLKGLGFSLKEIRAFDENSFQEKVKEIKNEIAELKNKLFIISSYNKMKGENKKMKPFINDENVLGKWEYVKSYATEEDIELNNDFVLDDIWLKEIYFLINGQGYWVFDRWTKGEIYHFSGKVYLYELKTDLLYLKIYSANNELEIINVYKQINNERLDIEMIKIKDDTDLPFEFDEKIIGNWEVFNFIDYDKKDSFDAKEPKWNGLFFSKVIFMPNGEVIQEYSNGNFRKNEWTKNYILDKHNQTVSNYIIKVIDGEDYLIIDWKSGDYIFGGKINGCYVFKRIK